MEYIYTYKIIVKVDQSNSEFNLDLYQIGNEALVETIQSRLKEYMSTNPARATDINPFETKTIGPNKLEVNVYYNEDLFVDIEDIEVGGNGKIDELVKNTIIESIPTKEGLPKPPIFKWEVIVVCGPKPDSIAFDSCVKRITFTLKRQLQAPETYTPDTTPFRRRGLVKIQGEEQYREVGQILGKDLVGNPTTVSSNNQTHVSASETDEQVENSIAVSVWYFKNKTTGNINTFENRSKIPKEKYTSEYERLKIILGLV